MDHESPVTRRTVLLGAGTTLLGGGALAYATTRPADATLTVSGLSVANATRTVGPSATLTGIRLDVSLQYEYSSSHTPDAVTLTLYVAPSGGSYSALDTLSLSSPTASDSGTVDLSGDLTDLDAWSVSDFDAAKGATTSTEVDIKAVMTLTRGGTTIGTADVGDSATVSVSREEITVSASIAGSGSLAVLTKSG